MNTTKAPKARGAVTLVELLVVIALIGLLLSLGVYFLPALNSQTRGAQGAALVQGWFNTARIMAARDQRPRGVRLYADPSRTVSKAQFLQAPDDFAVGQFYTTDGTTIQFSFPPSSGVVLSNEVQVGDHFEAFGGGLPRQIASVGATSVTLSSPLPYTIASSSINASSTPNYKIMRRARIADEDVLQLPKNVIINLDTNLKYSKEPTSPASSIDVVFAPNGRVIGNDANLYFWVHEFDGTKALNQSARFGTPTIVAIYARSGLITTYPVDITKGSDSYGLSNPYSLVR
jgi:prepilin-type N-terminal cleavage/methylation domain-containing protein